MEEREKILSQYKQLLDEGIITPEEYNAKIAPFMHNASNNVGQVYGARETEIPQVLPADDYSSKRAALIGKNTEYYMPVFEKLDQKGGTSWNWCSFFFTYVWFAYRKLYGWAAIAILVPLFAGAVCGLFLDSVTIDQAAVDVFLTLFEFGLNLVFGFVANGIYKKRIDKSIYYMPKDYAAREKYIQSKGGVNQIAAGIMAVIFVGVYILNMYLEG